MKKYLELILALLREYKHAIVTLNLLAIIGDILLIKFTSDLVTFIILGLLIISFKFYKFPFKRIFALDVIPIVVIFFGFIIDPYSMALDKASIWLFLLTGTGIVLQIFNKEERGK